MLLFTPSTLLQEIVVINVVINIRLILSHPLSIILVHNKLPQPNMGSFRLKMTQERRGDHHHALSLETRIVHCGADKTI